MQRRSNTLRSPNVGERAALFEVSPEVDVPMLVGGSRRRSAGNFDRRRYCPTEPALEAIATSPRPVPTRSCTRSGAEQWSR
jgi:hypothetical protein